uniref:Uncharacterized protein n=1 Tax=Panagrolaimus sp. ES5 TaxID=591445 RepID=A0AC34F6X7_9BILA
MLRSWKSHFILYFIFGNFIQNISARYSPTKTQQANAVKGQFMSHMLHSAYFFPHTVDVKWSATAQGKPDLPVWLHLFHSKHKSIAYLIGTPVTPLNQITIHVIARREDTFEMAEQFLTFIFKDDPRFNTSTQQIVDLLVKNVEPEEFFNDRRGKVQRFEKAIRETFRGKSINPYIFDVMPEVRNEPNKLYQHYLKQQKFGSLVKIGTQKFFHPNVKKLVIDLHESPNYCNRSEVIPLNKFFVTEFLIDWCAFRLIFPFLAVLCIILVLILSLIFFGRREGQHWRDYKTPKEQLQEYLNLRESQKHLRELSVQRQILLMNRKEIENEPLIAQRSSVAKQTVAEAAKATGSLLHLYRNPVDDTEEDEEIGDENEEQKQQR